MNRSIEDVEAGIIRMIREVQDRHYKELESLFYHLSQIQACKPPAPVILDTSNWTEAEKARFVEMFRDNGVLPREN